MSRKKKFLEAIRDHSETLKLYGVREIGIFGSVNRGDDREGSDYDVLVVFEKGKKNFRNFVAVSDLLEEQLGASVDMVTREGLSPHIGPSILKETEYVPIAC
jgi:predicted nucleotidyltransferase